MAAFKSNISTLSLENNEIDNLDWLTKSEITISALNLSKNKIKKLVKIPETFVSLYSLNFEDNLPFESVDEFLKTEPGKVPISYMKLTIN